MGWLDLASVVLNVLLGGSLVVTLTTLRAVRSKAEEEVNDLRAKIEGERIENEERASKVMMEYIVDPLKKELTNVRRDVRRLTNAINKAMECEYKDQCPVRDEMQKQIKED